MFGQSVLVKGANEGGSGVGPLTVFIGVTIPGDVKITAVHSIKIFAEMKNAKMARRNIALIWVAPKHLEP